MMALKKGILSTCEMKKKINLVGVVCTGNFSGKGDAFPSKYLLFFIITLQYMTL